MASLLEAISGSSQMLVAISFSASFVLLALGLSLMLSQCATGLAALLAICLSTSVSRRQRVLLGMMVVGYALLKGPEIGFRIHRRKSSAMELWSERMMKKVMQHVDALDHGEK